MPTNVEPGRPRNQAATETVLRSALELAYEAGVQCVTIERVSARSGVAKSTIYRRWPNAAAIVMDAFLADIAYLIEYHRCDNIADTFKITVQSLVDALAGRRGELLRSILGMAQRDPELRDAFLNRWIEPRRVKGEAALQEAAARGELAPEADLGMILDMIYGSVYYRLTVSFAAIEREYVDEIVDRTFYGLIRGR